MNPLQISIAIWFSSSEVRLSQVPRPQSHSNSTHRTGRDNAASYLSGRVSSLKVSSERFAVLLFIEAGPQRADRQESCFERRCLTNKCAACYGPERIDGRDEQ